MVPPTGGAALLYCPEDTQGNLLGCRDKGNPKRRGTSLSLLAKEELGGSRTFVVVLGFVFFLFLFLVAAA